jgi:hypothetical protein
MRKEHISAKILGSHLIAHPARFTLKHNTDDPLTFADPGDVHEGVVHRVVDTGRAGARLERHIVCQPAASPNTLTISVTINDIKLNHIRPSAALLSVASAMPPYL